MTQSEKLQKVIKRAVKNGWEDENSYSTEFKLELAKDSTLRKKFPETLKYALDDIATLMSFAPDFAKAYFGDEQCCYYCGSVDEICCPSCIETRGHGTTLCQYHVVKLALTPPSERIDYLFNFIENENIKPPKIS